MSTVALFEEKQVHRAWNQAEEKWYFAIIDVVAILTGSANPQVYWRVMKKRLSDEGNETVTNCNALKMTATNSKQCLTDAKVITDCDHLRSLKFSKSFLHAFTEHGAMMAVNILNSSKSVSRPSHRQIITSLSFDKFSVVPLLGTHLDTLRHCFAALGFLRQPPRGCKNPDHPQSHQ